MDLLSILRQLSMFNPNSIQQNPEERIAGPTPSYMDQQNQEDDNNDENYASKRFKELYNPSHNMQDAYNQGVLNPPQRNNPGLLRNILSVAGPTLASADRPEVAMQMQDQIRYAPYYRDMEDYSGRMKNLTGASTLEQRNNVDQRQLAETQLSRELTDRKNKSTDAQKKITADQNQQKINVMKDRAAIYKQRVEQELSKGAKLEFDRSGNAFMVQLDGSAIPVDQDLMSPADLLEAKHKYALSEIGSRGNESRKTKETAPGASEAVVVDPNNPTAPPVPVPDSKNKRIIKPSTQSNGTTSETIVDSNGNKITVRTPNKPNDRVMVISPAGIKGDIPKSKLSDALKRGYRMAK
jgi:hypothetical protein